jgi:RimJ/RimL family protein N-acetyltransferase
MLRGDYVVLRIPEADDAGIMTAWQNDMDVVKYMRFLYPVSKKKQVDIIREIASDGKSKIFLIENEDQVPIGTCSLTNIDWVNSTAEINVALYAKNCWGRGYGYDTVKTLTNFGMNEINLYTVYAFIPEDNERAVKCFQKAGYEIEGVLFNRFYMEGRYKSIFSMSISKGRRREG